MHIANKLAAVAAAITMMFVSAMPASADHRRQDNDAAVIFGTALAIVGIAIANSENNDHGHDMHGYNPPRNHGWRQVPPPHYNQWAPAPHHGRSLPPLRRIVDNKGRTAFLTPNGIPCGAYGLHGRPSYERGSTFMRTICYR